MTNDVESALQKAFQDTSQKNTNIYTACSGSLFTAWVYKKKYTNQLTNTVYKRPFPMNISEKEKGWSSTISKQTLVAYACPITTHCPDVPKSTSA